MAKLFCTHVTRSQDLYRLYGLGPKLAPFQFQYLIISQVPETVHNVSQPTT